jgi:hypothetical protein
MAGKKREGAIKHWTLPVLGHLKGQLGPKKHRGLLKYVSILYESINVIQQQIPTALII